MAVRSCRRPPNPSLAGSRPPIATLLSTWGSLGRRWELSDCSSEHSSSLAHVTSPFPDTVDPAGNQRQNSDGWVPRLPGPTWRELVLARRKDPQSSSRNAVQDEVHAVRHAAPKLMHPRKVLAYAPNATVLVRFFLFLARKPPPSRTGPGAQLAGCFRPVAKFCNKECDKTGPSGRCHSKSAATTAAAGPRPPTNRHIGRVTCRLCRNTKHGQAFLVPESNDPLDKMPWNTEFFIFLTVGSLLVHTNYISIRKSPDSDKPTGQLHALSSLRSSHDRAATRIKECHGGQFGSGLMHMLHTPNQPLCSALTAAKGQPCSSHCPCPACPSPPQCPPPSSGTPR